MRQMEVREWGEEWEGSGSLRGEGQERWPNGHESEWKSAIDGGVEVGASPGEDRDLG